MVKTKTLAVLLLALILAFSVGCSKKQMVKPVVEEQPVMTDVVEEIPVVEEEPVAEPAPVMLNCEDVFFDYDKHTLKPKAKTTLEMNAKELKNNTSAGVIIEGHCDERGTEDYNMALGEKRAKAVKEYLTTLGISASRFTVISYGESRPFDPGNTESAWAKNRRAHFVMKK
jgi:peptidoglycan-associated lipoprotein